MCRNMSLQSQAHKHYPKEHSISSYPWTIYIRWVTVRKIVCIQQIRYTNDWLQSQTPLKRPEVPSEMSKTDNEHQKWVPQVLPLTRGALGIWTGEPETITSCQRSINCAQRSMKQADFLWIQSLNSGKVKRRKEAKSTLDPVVPYSKNIVNSNTTILYAAQSSLQAAKDLSLNEKVDPKLILWNMPYAHYNCTNLNWGKMQETGKTAQFCRSGKTQRQTSHQWHPCYQYLRKWGIK